jgi:hypothetical protein
LIKQLRYIDAMKMLLTDDPEAFAWEEPSEEDADRLDDAYRSGEF